MRAGVTPTERDLLIAAVKTHLGTTHWMPGMPGMDFETRDAYMALLTKMERDAWFETGHKSLMADLVEDGLDAEWASDLAREWLAVVERGSAMSEANRRGALISHYLATGVPDEVAHEMTETLFARLAKNAERDMAPVD